MSHSLKVLEAILIEAKKQYELAEDAYADANIAASPFKVGERLIYRGSEYQIDRVNSMANCETSCLAFPIKKYGDVGVTRPVGIFSCGGDFTLKEKSHAA